MRNRLLAGLFSLLTVAGVGLMATPANALPSTPTPAGVTLEAKPMANNGKGVKKQLPPKGGPSARTTITCSAPACYYYAGKQQQGISTTTTGMQFVASVHAPAILSYDYHSLGQTAVRGVDNGDVIEAGWSVAPAQFGDSNPHFFVSSWTNGTWNGYSTGFSLAVGRPITPNDTLTSGTSITLRWDYFGPGCGCTQGWWLRYGGSYVGVYPETIWGAGNFASIDFLDLFGEMALGYDPSQSDMGTGALANATTGAQMTGYSLFGSAPSTAAWNATNVNAADRWPLVITSGNDFRYGGPGGTETIIGSVAADNCEGVGTGSAPSGKGSYCLYNTNPGLVPTGKVFQLDGSASASVCRSNLGTADGQTTTPISNVAISAYTKMVWFRDASCAGASQIFNHGRVTLPAGWTNLTHASYKTSTTLATCATGYPGTPPTC